MSTIIESSSRRWPVTASDEYIQGRKQLLQAEYDLREQIEQVAAMRRALPQGAVMGPYTFTEGPRDITATDGTYTNPTLADLVADGRTLVMYHLMFDPSDADPCPMCAMFVDGLNGVAGHLEQRANVVVCAAAPIEKIRAWAKKRGWENVRFVSSSGSGFNQDMDVEDPSAETKQDAGVSVFKKGEDGKVRHLYTQKPTYGARLERGLDLLCPVYNIFDLTPEGRGHWYAENGYMMS